MTEPLTIDGTQFRRYPRADYDPHGECDYCGAKTGRMETLLFANPQRTRLACTDTKACFERMDLRRRKAVRR